MWEEDELKFCMNSMQQSKESSSDELPVSSLEVNRRRKKVEKMRDF